MEDSHDRVESDPLILEPLSCCSHSRCYHCLVHGTHLACSCLKWRKKVWLRLVLCCVGGVTANGCGLEGSCWNTFIMVPPIILDGFAKPGDWKPLTCLPWFSSCCGWWGRPCLSSLQVGWSTDLAQCLSHQHQRDYLSLWYKSVPDAHLLSWSYSDNKTKQFLYKLYK